MIETLSWAFKKNNHTHTETKMAVLVLTVLFVLWARDGVSGLCGAALLRPARGHKAASLGCVSAVHDGIEPLLHLQRVSGLSC